MEDACADDLFERLSQFGRVFDGELMELEVVEGVAPFQLPREREAVRAHVDPDDARAGPAQRIVCGLHGAAAGDEHAAVVPKGSAGQKRCDSARRRASPHARRYDSEIVDRRRIGMRFVKGAYAIVTHARGEPFHAGRISIRHERALLTVTYLRDY